MECGYNRLVLRLIWEGLYKNDGASSAHGGRLTIDSAPRRIGRLMVKNNWSIAIL